MSWLEVEYRSSVAGFHSDMSFLPEPATATLLLPHSVPTSAQAGNGTDLVDMAGAYVTLPKETRQLLAGLDALPARCAQLRRQPGI